MAAEGEVLDIDGIVEVEDDAVNAGVEFKRAKRFVTNFTLLEDLVYRDMAVSVDTETTGRGPSPATKKTKERRITDQVVEIGVVRTKTKEVIYHSYVKPTVNFDPEALRKTGFDKRLVKDARPWAEVFPEFAEATTGFVKIAWNAEFDQRMVNQTSFSTGFDAEGPGMWQYPLDTKTPAVHGACILGVGPWADMMRIYGGIRGRSTHTKLLTALELEDVPMRGKAHTAVADAMAMTELIHAILRPTDVEQIAEVLTDVELHRKLGWKNKEVGAGEFRKPWSVFYYEKADRLWEAGYEGAARVASDFAIELENGD